MSFPDDSDVEVRYPLTPEQEHVTVPRGRGCPARSFRQSGPGEWQICVQTPELAMPDADGEATFPAVLPGCLRTAPGRAGGRAMSEPEYGLDRWAPLFSSPARNWPTPSHVPA